MEQEKSYSGPSGSRGGVRTVCVCVPHNRTACLLLLAAPLLDASSTRVSGMYAAFM